MKEEEIRPKKIFDEYLQYCKEDVEKYFKDKKPFITVSCPSCNSNEIKESFVKNGFTYNLCEKCKTLYVSPLPPEENFREYYTKGKSVEFWVTDFYKHTEKERRKKIVIPKWNLIKKLINDKSVDTIIDIGAGYGTFCEVAKKDYDNVVAIEPSPIFQKVLEKKGIKTIQKFMENIERNDLNSISEGKRLFCSFELWEHLYNPKKFLDAVNKIMNKGDYLLITTLNVLGFDILALWEKSKSVSPPHHINLFNLDSLKKFLTKNGFEITKAITPGKLDVDIVRNMNIKFDNKLCEYMINKSSKEFREKFQIFIEKNKLSSHMMVIAKKN